MAYKSGNPYKPLRALVGAQEARRLCPSWRMVTAALTGPRPTWVELDHAGGGGWRDGAPPAPVGVVCDQDWRPVYFETPGGHRLPRLGGELEDGEAAG